MMYTWQKNTLVGQLIVLVDVHVHDYKNYIHLPYRASTAFLDDLAGVSPCK